MGAMQLKSKAPLRLPLVGRPMVERYLATASLTALGGPWWDSREFRYGLAAYY
jgi:hypothetical protein